MSQWQAPPAHLQLAPGDVHLWRLRLAQLVGDRALLAPDEQLRADRFHYDGDRQYFIAARSGLRRILGDYLGVNPAAIEFGYGSHGKPYLANRKLADRMLADDTIEFNLSHSGDLALVGVTIDRSVGVDVELIKPMADLEKLTARFLTPGEHQRIVQLDQADRLLAFFRTWTCKEAYLKATGEGLGQLKSIEVVVQPQHPAQLLRLPNWDLLELEPEVGYVGAIVCDRPKVIAASGRDWRVSFFEVRELPF
jgi:4'-phosphopantetheinyl transferase